MTSTTEFNELGELENIEISDTVAYFARCSIFVIKINLYKGHVALA